MNKKLQIGETVLCAEVNGTFFQTVFTAYDQRQLFVVHSLPNPMSSRPMVEVKPYSNVPDCILDISLDHVHKLWNTDRDVFISKYDNFSFSYGEVLTFMNKDRSEYGLYSVYVNDGGFPLLVYPWQMEPVGVPTEDKCTCDINLLMIAGCKCGWMQKERQNG